MLCLCMYTKYISSPNTMFSAVDVSISRLYVLYYFIQLPTVFYATPKPFHHFTKRYPALPGLLFAAFSLHTVLPLAPGRPLFVPHTLVNRLLIPPLQPPPSPPHPTPVHPGWILLYNVQRSVQQPPICVFENPVAVRCHSFSLCLWYIIGYSGVPFPNTHFWGSLCSYNWAPCMLFFSQCKTTFSLRAHLKTLGSPILRPTCASPPTPFFCIKKKKYRKEEASHTNQVFFSLVMRQKEFFIC